MNAVSSITIRPLERPQFNNVYLGKPKDWALDNAALLARYWRDQGNVFGFAQDDDTDFDFWLRVQHDIELNSKPVRRRVSP